MKIATFNVNGVNGRLALVLKWLAESRPDIACLQELKAPQDRFPVQAIEKAGYGAVWAGEKAWNGVAILARGATPIVNRGALPGDPADAQARYLEAEVGEWLVASLYLPNGNPRPGPKWAYKLAWFERLIRHARRLVDLPAPVALAGDFNVMPTELDVYAPERWVDDALFHADVRAAHARLLAQGWTDAIRALHPAERVYTFWKYFRNAFARDAGLRIDHLLLNRAAAGRLGTAGVDREMRGRKHASDHAPVWVDVGRPTGA